MHALVERQPDTNIVHLCRQFRTVHVHTTDIRPGANGDAVNGVVLVLGRRRGACPDKLHSFPWVLMATRLQDGGY